MKGLMADHALLYSSYYAAVTRSCLVGFKSRFGQGCWRLACSTHWDWWSCRRRLDSCLLSSMNSRTVRGCFCQLSDWRSFNSCRGAVISVHLIWRRWVQNANVVINEGSFLFHILIIAYNKLISNGMSVVRLIWWDYCCWQFNMGFKCCPHIDKLHIKHLNVIKLLMTTRFMLFHW